MKSSIRSARLPHFVLFTAILTILACQREMSTAPPSPEDMRISADWAAWINRMPPGPPSLHVEGTLHMPHPGYHAELMPRQPQGINPAILLMDMHLEEVDGPVAQVLTDIPVNYSEDPYDGPCNQVQIFYPNGDSVLLPLTEAF